MQSVSPDFQKLRVRGKAPSLPTGIRIYAVGDIHGRLDLLNELLGLIAADLERRPAARALKVFLGDYIDRGAASRETIDRLIEHSQTHESVFLKGNHEQIAIRSLSDRGVVDQWLRLGGTETLMSYGVPAETIAAGKPIVGMQSAFHSALPQSHFRFFRDLRASFELGDFFFAHAGVKPGVELSQQRENDLLWIRDEFLGSSRDFGKIVVHGHTPATSVEVGTNRINIDTGAYATGRLTSLVIEDESLTLIDTAR